MSEYIKRQDAIDAIKSVPTGNWSSKRYAGETGKIPPVDVKPVVRGKWYLHDAMSGRGESGTIVATSISAATAALI